MLHVLMMRMREGMWNKRKRKKKRRKHKHTILTVEWFYGFYLEAVDHKLKGGRKFAEILLGSPIIALQ